MYKVGEYIIKPINGICEITDIAPVDMAGGNRNKLYYFLTPINDKGTKIYVPVDKENNGIRRVITQDEAWNIIKEIENMDEVWIDNDKQREQRYKEALKNCNLREIIGIIKNMYHRKVERSMQGKKNTLVDQKYFKQAEDMLYSELAFTLGKNKDDIKEIIFQTVNENKA